MKYVSQRRRYSSTPPPPLTTVLSVTPDSNTLTMWEFSQDPGWDGSTVASQFQVFDLVSSTWVSPISIAVNGVDVLNVQYDLTVVIDSTQGWQMLTQPDGFQPMVVPESGPFPQ